MTFDEDFEKEVERRYASSRRSVEKAAKDYRDPTGVAQYIASRKARDCGIRKPELLRRGVSITLSRTRNDAPVSRDYQGPGILVAIQFEGDEDLAIRIVYDITSRNRSLGSASRGVDANGKPRIEIFHSVEVDAMGTSEELKALKTGIVEKTRITLDEFETIAKRVAPVFDRHHAELAAFALPLFEEAIEREKRIDDFEGELSAAIFTN